MIKRNKRKGLRKEGAFFMIANIILSLFAFAVLISEVGVVEGQVADGIYINQIRNVEVFVNGPDQILYRTIGDTNWLKSAYDAEVITQANGFNYKAAVANTNTGTDGGVLGDMLGLDKGSFGFEGGTFGTWYGQAGYGIFMGLQYAALAYGIGQLIGSLFGLEKGQTQALSTALAAGAFTWSFLYEVGVGSAEKGLFWLEGGGLLSAPFLLGLGVAAAVFLYMNEKVKVKVVTFECLPWQAPSGGENCELCNDDDLPCSEYRCRSLGQNCEVVNPGTEQEKCVNVNPRDVNPPVITPDENELSAGHKYTNVKSSPPEPGFEIVNLNSADGCLKAFSPLKFGITVDEPSQCKIDFNHTTKFDEMRSYFGGSNYYLYNHTEQFVLPSAAAFKNSSLVLRNGKELEFFVRCKDKNGNENSAEYAVRFCIDPSPDTTAPKISATSIENGACVAENQNSANVDFYTNEPSECRWSTTDQSYENMQNDMTCLNELYQLNGAQLFTCSANLTGIAKDNTNYYVRCKDQPGEEENNRNENAESYEFSLRGSSGLKMKTLRPNGTIFGGVDPAPIEIYAETQYGCNEGRSVCFYSASGDERDRVMFFDTNNEDGISTQRQDLSAGEHEYLIQCVDAGGNVAEDKLKFKLDIDTSAPVVARAYEEDGMLKIVTVRKSECAYTTKSCDFTFKEGTEMPYANTTVHVTEWNNKNTYYIKCKDEFRNEEASCSIIVKPSSNFL